MGIVTMIAQLVLSLSILVVLHEMGHFFPAKWFRTRVEKFYLFFNPWFSIFRKKIGETEYGLGWLPLGGYVKIAGMIDESLDTEQLQEEPQPWEFRSKPAWQRLIIMLGGVTVNFILGFLIFGFLLYAYGERYLPAENARYGIAVDSLGRELGLRDGDQILQIGEVSFDKFNPSVLRNEVVVNDARSVRVLREGREIEIPVDPKFVSLLSSYTYRNYTLFEPRMPLVIKQFQKNLANAREAGLESGDQIIGVGNTETPFKMEAQNAFRDSKGKTVDVRVEREDRELTFDVPVSPEGMIGVITYGPDHFFAFERQKYSLLQALPMGVAKGWNFLTSQLKVFGQMFRGKIKASESLGGFGTITNLFPRTWRWESFWYVTAILSLILGFMNLLPIPALDGGHVMFLIWEVVTGRKPSDKFLEYATIVGFVIVIGLVLYANGLDIYRWLNK